MMPSKKTVLTLNEAIVAQDLSILYRTLRDGALPDEGSIQLALSIRYYYQLRKTGDTSPTHYDPRKAALEIARAYVITPKTPFTTLMEVASYLREESDAASFICKCLDADIAFNDEFLQGLIEGDSWYVLLECIKQGVHMSAGVASSMWQRISGCRWYLIEKFLEYSIPILDDAIDCLIDAYVWYSRDSVDTLLAVIEKLRILGTPKTNRSMSDAIATGEINKVKLYLKAGAKFEAGMLDVALKKPLSEENTYFLVKLIELGAPPTSESLDLGIQYGKSRVVRAMVQRNFPASSASFDLAVKNGRNGVARAVIRYLGRPQPSPQSLNLVLNNRWAHGELFRTKSMRAAYTARHPLLKRTLSDIRERFLAERSVSERQQEEIEAHLEVFTVFALIGRCTIDYATFILRSDAIVPLLQLVDYATHAIAAIETGVKQMHWVKTSSAMFREQPREVIRTALNEMLQDPKRCDDFLTMERVAELAWELCLNIAAQFCDLRYLNPKLAWSLAAEMGDVSLTDDSIQAICAPIVR